MSQKSEKQRVRRRKGAPIVRYNAASDLQGSRSDEKLADGRFAESGPLNAGLAGRLWPRFAIAALLLIATQGVLWGMARGFSPSEVSFDRSAFLAWRGEFDNWQAEEIELDPRLFVAVGAEATLNRILKRGGVQVVSTHVAAFTHRHQLVPHLPAVCYEGAGQVVSGQESVAIPGTKIRARLLTLEMGDESAYALYWYQRGQESYVDRDTGRTAVQKFWGKPVWPPLFKVLLQTSADNKEQALERLVSVAQELSNHLDHVLNASDHS